MYLSRLHLENWRSYEHTTIDFKAPQPGRPLVLMGGMNGHGKTSLLYAIYLGLFGKEGVAYTEALRRREDGEGLRHYTRAMKAFRRAYSPLGEPTEVDIEFRPGPTEPQAKVVRVVRRWHYNLSGDLKPQADEVELYLDEGRVRGADDERVRQALSRHLFDPSVMAAFFFDGEQAQEVVKQLDQGQSVVLRTVRTMFGTLVLEQTEKRLQAYAQRISSDLGGRSSVADKQRKVEESRSRWARERADLKGVEDRLAEVSERLEVDQARRAELLVALERLGGDKSERLLQLQRELGAAREREGQARKELERELGTLAQGLALSRLYGTLIERLRAEDLREGWSSLWSAARDRIEPILNDALPIPVPEGHELYPAARYLNLQVLEEFRERFRRAMERSLAHQPPGCAPEFLLPHLRGEQRVAMKGQLEEIQGRGAAMAGPAKALREVRQRSSDLAAQEQALRANSVDTTGLQEELAALNAQIREGEHERIRLKHARASRATEVSQRGRELAKAEAELRAMVPEVARLDLAERVRRVLKGAHEELAPLVQQRLEGLLGEHFHQLADPRWREGTIRLGRSDAPPMVELPGGQPISIENMSGAERRAFCMSFALATARLTAARLPFIIDTPLGPSDSAYRRRLLDSLSRSEADQIILLAHDQEIPPEVARLYEGATNERFLLSYDPGDRCTRVERNSYLRG